jgi:hypothetical protein
MTFENLVIANAWAWIPVQLNILGILTTLERLEAVERFVCLLDVTHRESYWSEQALKWKL